MLLYSASSQPWRRTLPTSIGAVLIVPCLVSSAFAAEVSVDTMPGDTIILSDGTYTGPGTIDLTAYGEEDNPIVVRAETPGGVILTGEPTFVNITGSYLVLHGFHFKDIWTEGNWNTLLIRLFDAHHCRVTNCRIENVHQTGALDS